MINHIYIKMSELLISFEFKIFFFELNFSLKKFMIVLHNLVNNLFS
jgi:hypothetical protein